MYSVVLYLTETRKVARSLHIVRLHRGEIVHRFRSVPLWTVPTEELLNAGGEGLLPLIPLSRERLQYQFVDQAIQRLVPLSKTYPFMDKP